MLCPANAWILTAESGVINECQRISGKKRKRRHDRHQAHRSLHWQLSERQFPYKYHIMCRNLFQWLSEFGKGDDLLDFTFIEKSHLSEIAEMYVEAFNAPPWNDEWTIETASKRILQMMNCEGFSGLACFDDNLLCGMILGNMEYFYDGIHFVIKEFCVRLNRRGTGIGSNLLNEFENKLLKMGVSNTYLFTSRTDETESFYNKRGYNSLTSMVMMSKKLNHSK